jgi:hypothetical protein
LAEGKRLDVQGLLTFFTPKPPRKAKAVIQPAFPISGPRRRRPRLEALPILNYSRMTPKGQLDGPPPKLRHKGEAIELLQHAMSFSTLLGPVCFSLDLVLIQSSGSVRKTGVDLGRQANSCH